METNPQSAVNPPKGEKKFNSTIEWLLDKIESYLKKNAATGLTDASFGWASIKDTGLVDRLRSGGDVTTRKLDALIRYMSNSNSKEKDNIDGKQSKRQKTSQKGKEAK